MSFHVTLSPSGQTFACEAHETLLEAALRCGINVNHHCAAGTCGDCRAKLLQGEVKRHPHDYRLTEAEKLLGMVLMCSSTPRSDLRLEALTANSPDDIPLQQIDAQVRKLTRLSDDYLALTVRTPRTRTLRFLAGQSARLTFEGYPTLTLPIASCPCNGLMLEFHVRRQRGEPLNDLIFNQLKPGTKVGLEGPCGRFTLDEGSRRPMIMVALETGFAPIKSLIEHAIALEVSQPIRLYWYTHTPSGHYQANYCHSWTLALDDFTYYPRVLSPSHAHRGGSIQVVEELRPAWRALGEVDIYLAGDDPTVEAVVAAALADGVPGHHLITQHGCGI